MFCVGKEINSDGRIVLNVEGNWMGGVGWDGEWGGGVCMLGIVCQ